MCLMDVIFDSLTLDIFNPCTEISADGVIVCGAPCQCVKYKHTELDHTELALSLACMGLHREAKKIKKGKGLKREKKQLKNQTGRKV